jgi:hypothetical protein
MTKEELKEKVRKFSEFLRAQAKASKMHRLKDETSGVSDKEAGWWIQTTNLCSVVSHACDRFFERRGTPLPEFNFRDFPNQNTP